MKKYNGFIRAFWRRIEIYKNDFEKELPEKMPVEFSAAFGTANILLRRAPVLHQFRYKEKNECCVDFGEYSEWENCNKQKLEEINEYIKEGYSYEVRSLVVADNDEVNFMQ